MRYSGTSLAYQVGQTITSAPIQIVATVLIDRYHSSNAVALYMIASAALGFAASATAPTARRRDGIQPGLRVDKATVSPLPRASSFPHRAGHRGQGVASWHRQQSVEEFPVIRAGDVCGAVAQVLQRRAGDVVR